MATTIQRHTRANMITRRVRKWGCWKKVTVSHTVPSKTEPQTAGLARESITDTGFVVAFASTVTQTVHEQLPPNTAGTFWQPPKALARMLRYLSPSTRTFSRVAGFRICSSQLHSVLLAFFSISAWKIYVPLSIFYLLCRMLIWVEISLKPFSYCEWFPLLECNSFKVDLATIFQKTTTH